MRGGEGASNEPSRSAPLPESDESDLLLLSWAGHYRWPGHAMLTKQPAECAAILPSYSDTVGIFRHRP